MTFDQCAAAYIKTHRAGWNSKKHTKQWGSTMATYASPVFGKLPVAAVDVGLVLKVLELDLEAEKRDGEPAARPASSPFSIGPRWHGYRTGENPARWRGHLDHLLPERSKVRKVEHHAALPYRELPAFMASLREQKGIAARALEFTILTAPGPAKRSARAGTR